MQLRKKKAVVRILDTPMKLMIEPTFIAVPLPNGQIMILTGDFEHIRDDEAYRLAADAKDRLNVA